MVTLSKKSQLKSSTELKAPKSKKVRKEVRETKPTKYELETAAEIGSPDLLKRLADSDGETCNKAVEIVLQLVVTKRRLEFFELQKLWKGLWFAMWRSDTPLVQQALARDLASLVNKVAARNTAAFADAFWSITIREWGSLDRYRINKFYMLVRFVLHEEFSRLQALKWQPEAVSSFAEQLVSPISGPLSYGNLKAPHSLRLHLIDIYIDELAKVVDMKLPPLEVLRILLRPVLSQTELSEFKHIKKHVAEDVLPDERLVEWKIVDAKPIEELQEDSEWERFD